MTPPHPSTRRVRRAGAKATPPAGANAHAPPARRAERGGGARAAFSAALVSGVVAAPIDCGDDAGAWEMLARAAAIDCTRYEIPLYRAGILLRAGRPGEAIARLSGRNTLALRRDRRSGLPLAWGGGPLGLPARHSTDSVESR